MNDYGAREVKRLFGLSASTVRSLERAGFVHPQKRGALETYTFQDMVVFRAVAAMRAAHYAPRKVHAALRRLSVTSGQYELPLEVHPSGKKLVRIEDFGTRAGDITGRQSARALSAQDHFDRGLALEDEDTAAARAAYQACLDADSAHVDARINLGRLLHLAKLLSQAEAVYRACEQANALVSFNLAIVLEDQQRELEAMLAYRAALGCDPRLADAHFNLARLHDRQGEKMASLRHLLAYRRITSTHGA